MKSWYLITLLLTPILLSAGSATRTWELGKLRITTPVEYSEGVPFTVEVELLTKHGEPESLELVFHHLAGDGTFAGRLYDPDSHKIFSDVGRFETELVIPHNPPNLGLALLTVYLSPDRSWEQRSLQADVPLRPAGGGGELYDQVAAEALRKGATSPLDVEAGLEEYESRPEYFTQREEDPEGREWTLYPPNFPPMEEVLAAVPPPCSPAGIYCWPQEYEAAHKEIAAMGIRAVRMAGPWGAADGAMRAAATTGTDVFFTLMIGEDLAAYRQGRRPNFASDAAFARAFQDSVSTFLLRFGPGGSFEGENGVLSPLVGIGIWNEPNFQYMIPNTGDQAADEAAREALYPLLVKAGHAAVREHAPSIRVVGFSSGGADFADERFIRHVHAANPELAEFYDVLATHPYNKGAPPEARKINFWGQYSIADGRAVIRDLYREIGIAEKPVWYTELGWAIARKHGGRFPSTPNRVRNVVTPDLQAAYVVRAWLLALRLQVERVFIMNLHDTDGFNAGFIDRDSHEWRPVAHAARYFNATLPHPRLAGSVFDGADGLYGYRYKADHTEPDSPDVWVFWNVAGPRQIELPWPAASARLTDMVGNEREVEVEAGTLKLNVGPYPLYLFADP